MDKYAELIREMSDASLTQVRELNETIRCKDHAYHELCITYDLLFEEHEQLLEEHEALKRDYELALDKIWGLCRKLADC